MYIDENRSFIKYLLLNFITCGIYGLYFFYKLVEDQNYMLAGDGEDSPNYIIVMLLSVITCGIYEIYWVYKQGNRLSRAGQERFGIRIDENGGTLLLWAVLGYFFLHIGNLVTDYFIIKNMNKIAHEFNLRNGNGGGGSDTYGSGYDRESFGGTSNNYNQGGTYDQNNYGQNNYDQNNYNQSNYNQGGTYGQNPYNQGNPYSQNDYNQGNPYNQGNTYGQNDYNQGNPYGQNNYGPNGAYGNNDSQGGSGGDPNQPR